MRAALLAALVLAACEPESYFRVVVGQRDGGIAYYPLPDSGAVDAGRAPAPYVGQQFGWRFLSGSSWEEVEIADCAITELREVPCDVSGRKIYLTRGAPFLSGFLTQGTGIFLTAHAASAVVLGGSGCRPPRREVRQVTVYQCER